MSVDALGGMLDFVRTLVGIDSRADLDDQTAVLDAVGEWLTRHQIEFELLRDGDRPIAICGEVDGGTSGPACLLNATLDTAPFGDLETWSDPPLAANVRDGWLFGRGSADCKSGVGIFCHVLAELARRRVEWRGSVAFVFDVDEHSGLFGGIRRWHQEHGANRQFVGAMVGYPGDDRIVVGCRGFHRATIVVHGVAAHSGSSSRHGVNAVRRAATLVERLATEALGRRSDADRFPLPPKATTTAIRGGSSFSTVPDRCEIDVDFRLTPDFRAQDADTLLAALVEQLDAARIATDGATLVTPPTEVVTFPGYPPYALDDDVPVCRALADAARAVLGRSVPMAVAGPSSVANFLHQQGLPATSGFGVRYRHLHAADECVEIASMAPTFRIYLTAVMSLLR